MAMLREVGYDKPVYLHGTLEANSSYHVSCPYSSSALRLRLPLRPG
jgi:hypothetical protein